MKNSMKAMIVMFALCAAALTLAADLDNRHAWTMAGSAGMVDESDIGDVVLRGSIATFTPVTPAGSATIRYNIAATDALVGQMDAGQSWHLNVSFRDTGPNDRVRVYLKQRRLVGSSGVATLAAFDSDDYEADPRPTFRTELKEIDGGEFDFRNNLYYLEVVLSKLGSSRGAGIAGASLCPADAAE